MLGLRWDDIDFAEGQIRWRADTDKLRKTWVVPASQAVLDELNRFGRSSRDLVRRFSSRTRSHRGTRESR